MPHFMTQDWFFIPAVSFCVFIIVYFYFKKISEFFEKKTLGQKGEIIRLLDLMFVDISEKNITILLVLLSFGLGAIVFLVLLPNVLLGLGLSVAMTLLGGALPMIYVKSIYDSRCNKLVDQMVDGLTIMANGIKSGLGITQSMERVVENLPNPISQEFSLVLSQIRLGRSVEDALIDFGVRIPKADVQMFVTAINILKETGGNLAETFTTIVVTIRERQKVEKKIEAMTAQGLTQGMIISSVPILLIFVFMFIDPNFIKPLFTTTLGIVLLFVMVMMLIIGGVTIRKIVKIKV